MAITAAGRQNVSIQAQESTKQTAEVDPNVRELQQKVSRLVQRDFGGDYQAAFRHFDANHNNGISSDELKELLRQAGVGNGLTRGMWTSGVMDRLDTNHDGSIQWREFTSATPQGPTPPRR